jgi:hypothetical protein
LKALVKITNSNMRVSLAIQLILQLSHSSQLRVVRPSFFFTNSYSNTLYCEHVILWTVSIVSEVLKT